MVQWNWDLWHKTVTVVLLFFLFKNRWEQKVLQSCVLVVSKKKKKKKKEIVKIVFIALFVPIKNMLLPEF